MTSDGAHLWEECMCVCVGHRHKARWSTNSEFGSAKSSKKTSSGSVSSSALVCLCLSVCLRPRMSATLCLPLIPAFLFPSLPNPKSNFLTRTMSIFRGGRGFGGSGGPHFHKTCPENMTFKKDNEIGFPQGPVRCCVFLEDSILNPTPSMT